MLNNKFILENGASRFNSFFEILTFTLFTYSVFQNVFFISLYSLLVLSTGKFIATRGLLERVVKRPLNTVVFKNIAIIFLYIFQLSFTVSYVLYETDLDNSDLFWPRIVMFIGVVMVAKFIWSTFVLRKEIDND